MSDVQHVDATTIDADISPLSKAEAWLAQATERVAALAEQYRVPDELADERAYKDAKASRASVRKDAKELDDERKRMTREMDDALKKFRTDVKGVLEPLTEIDVAYKRALDDYEVRWGQQRRAALQEAYDDYAPDLVPLVPLDRIIARYGSESGKGWLNRSTNVEAAKAGLRGAIDGIALGERTVEGAVDPEDAEGAKADFFSSLDVGSAIQAAQARAEQRERVRRLEEERRQREEEQRRIEQEAAERMERERQERLERERLERERAAQERPAPEPQAMPYEPQAMPYEPPRILEQPPAPSPLIAHVAETMGQPNAGSVPPYIMCAYGTRADADSFKAWCAQRGIKATIKPTGGSVYRITRK